MGRLILYVIGAPESIQRGVANYLASILVWLPSAYGYAWFRFHVGHTAGYVFLAVSLLAVWMVVTRILAVTYQTLAGRYSDELDD
jgi:hypothetical protein